MGWIVLTVIIGIVCIGMALLFWKGLNWKSSDPEDKYWVLGISGTVFGVFLIVWVVLTLIHSISPVKAGNVGLVYGVGGNIIGQTGEGIHFIAPWHSLKSVSVQKQSYRSTDQCHDADGNKTYDNCVSAFTKDTQNAFIIGTLNYHIDSKDVQQLYTQNPNFVDVYIRPRFLQAIKDVAVQYTATDMAPNREEIRQKVKTTLEQELSTQSIQVEDFLIDNIDFSQKFEQAIEKKQEATQNALTEQNNVAVSKAQAEQKAAAAQGDADALRVTAQGQADANALISKSLTPELIQFQFVQKLADKVQVIYLPSGTNNLLNLPSPSTGP